MYGVIKDIKIEEKLGVKEATSTTLLNKSISLEFQNKQPPENTSKAGDTAIDEIIAAPISTLLVLWNKFPSLSVLTLRELSAQDLLLLRLTCKNLYQIVLMFLKLLTGELLSRNLRGSTNMEFCRYLQQNPLFVCRIILFCCNF